VVIQRPQWPHTVDDIVKSLDGIWGLVGATAVSGNLLRLERSLHQPLTYTVTEYEGMDETKVVRKNTYSADQKQQAISDFAKQLGFSDN
jgi:hypothetical protein